MTISLGCELPHTSCGLPEAANLAIQVTGSHLPMRLLLLDLAPCGGYLAAGITACAGGLLHHLFTLTPYHGGKMRSVSVALFRQVAPSRELPGTMPCGVRTFLNDLQPLRSSDQPGTSIIPYF